MSENWIEATTTGAVREGEVAAVEIAGRDVALYLVEGKFYATDNICTHGQGRLSDGFLEGHIIECPLHQGKFDVRTGAPLCPPVDTSIQTYPTRCAGDKVLVAVG
jgi:naphthalene 1,2-dioxygenase system ferredoxin subunit